METRYLEFVNRDWLNRRVPIGVIVGDVKDVPYDIGVILDRHNGWPTHNYTHFVIIYDLPETMAAGANTVNGIEKHVPQTWHKLVAGGTLTPNSYSHSHEQTVFIHMSDPLLEGICQTDLILLDWINPKGQWECKRPTWKYILPENFEQMTGLDPRELVRLVC